ncbi:hypothetical protein ACQ4PT_048209 [Festuca glaucescens]
MGQGDLLDDSFPAKRGSKGMGQKPRKKRNNSEDGNTGKGRAKDRHSDSSMNLRGMKNQNASQSANASTAVTNILVEGCELEPLCMFLRNCIQSFPAIAMDKFGSHVAEAALKSLATHLEDETSRVIVEEILNKICKVIAADATNVMCSCYGSHVLRTLLCLCKAVPLDSLKDFHTTKRSAVLAERLSCGSSRSGDQNPANFEHGFSDMFKTFVRQMLQKAENGISTLLTEKNSSLVLQTVLKLSTGDDHELNHIISILLGYDEDDTAQKKDNNEQKNKIVALLEDTAYSHLLEMKQIWEELGPKIKELLELAIYSQYVASLLALDDDQILQIAKDSGGSRVLEAFLCSSATAKQKFKVFANYRPPLPPCILSGGTVISPECPNLERKQRWIRGLAALSMRKIDFRAIEDNLFSVQMHCLGDWERVMKEGPWTFRECHVLMAHYDGWSPVHTVELYTYPAWVRVLDLSEKIRTGSVASQLARKAGKFVKIDEKSVKGHGDGDGVRYEKMPEFCGVCGLVGHVTKEHGSGLHEEGDIIYPPTLIALEFRRDEHWGMIWWKRCRASFGNGSQGGGRGRGRGGQEGRGAHAASCSSDADSEDLWNTSSSPKIPPAGLVDKHGTAKRRLDLVKDKDGQEGNVLLLTNKPFEEEVDETESNYQDSKRKKTGDAKPMDQDLATAAGPKGCPAGANEYWRVELSRGGRYYDSSRASPVGGTNNDAGF